MSGKTQINQRSGGGGSRSKSVRSALKDPLALYVLSQDVIIWIAPSTFSQAASALSSVTW
eukprot:1145562-Pelagomonas_calceolata.AAC.2